MQATHIHDRQIAPVENRNWRTIVRYQTCHNKISVTGGNQTCHNTINLIRVHYQITLEINLSNPFVTQFNTRWYCIQHHNWWALRIYREVYFSRTRDRYQEPTRVYYEYFHKIDSKLRDLYYSGITRVAWRFTDNLAVCSTASSIYQQRFPIWGETTS